MSNTLDVLQVRVEKGTFPVGDFLALSPEKLSQFEQNIQRDLKILYDLNGEKNLYKSFPTWNTDKPLTIDCCFRKTEHEGAYHPSQNLIEFGQKKKENWLDVLAHELKHAEQNDLYTYERTMGRPYQQLKQAGKVDALSMHQIQYLMEAQAFAFDQYVLYLHREKNKPTSTPFRSFFKKYFKTDILKSYPEYEQQFILDQLPWVMGHNVFRDNNDYLDTIGDFDKGLTEIPQVFGLDKTYCQEKLLPALQKAPREARRPNLRCLQLIRNGHLEEARSLLDQKDESGQPLISPREKERLLYEFSKAPTQPKKAHTLTPPAPKKDLRNLFNQLDRKVERLENEINKCEQKINSLRQTQLAYRQKFYKQVA